MKENFALALAHVLASEGGYVNDKLDPGGATDEGVTQHQYDLWRIAHGQPTRSVKFIDPNEVDMFYRAWYWNPVGADSLPSGVDYCVFDCAVNSGPHRAAQWLQMAVGAEPDGYVGAATLAGVFKEAPAAIIEAVTEERQAFLERLPTYYHFKNGWTERVQDVREAAEAMA